MDYVVRLTGQDNLSGTINNVKGAVNDLSNSVSNLDKFTDKFKRIEGSAAPLKKQLRDLKSIMAEMNFQGLSGTEEFTRIAQYAGQVKDAMDDAGAATRRFADDTFALKAAADTMTVVTGAFTAATGAMSLFGVENENVKNAILKVQSAMAVLNGVQAIANALNKDSALMQALKAMRMKISEAVTRANTTAIKANTVAENISTTTTKKDTVAKAANTVAETVNGAATKKSTIIQNAWNVAKAVAKALLGDFTGLAIVAAGAIATYAMATGDSTDEIKKNNKATADSTDALDNNTGALGDNSNALNKNSNDIFNNKEMHKEWAEQVGSSAASQLTTYSMLQKKWEECNGDVKLQQKFMHDYKNEIDSLGLGIYSLLDAEHAFVTYTDKVVNAIIARAKAEAYKSVIQKEYEKWVTDQNNPTVENGGAYVKAKDKEPMWAEEANKIGIGQGDYTYHNIHTGVYTLTEQGKAKVNAYRKAQAIEKMRARDKRYRDNIERYRQSMLKEYDNADKELADAGLSGRGYNAATGGGAKGVYGNYGKGGSHGSRSHHSGSSSSGSSSSKPNEPSDEDKLRTLEAKVLDMNRDLQLDLVPEGELEKYMTDLASFSRQYDELAEKLGAPLIGSLDWKKKELSDLQKMMTSGLIDEKDLDKAKILVEKKKDEIEADEIELGFKDPKTLEEELDDQIKDLEKYLATNIDILPQKKIDETKNRIKELTKQKFELRVRLGLEDALRTDFEKNDFVDKYINDWKDLEQYADDYAKKWEEYQQNLRKYEADVAEYNAAWDAYNAKMVKYNEQQKQFAKYNDLLKKRDELESKHNNEQISDDKYEKESKALDEQIDKISNKLWPAVEGVNNELDDFNAKVADLNEQLRKGLITAEQFEVEFEKLCSSGNELSNVMVKGFAKPIKPKLEMPKKPFDPMVHALIDDIYSALDGIPAHTEKLMSEVEEMLRNNDLPIGVRIELANNVKQQLQERLDEQTHGKLSIKATVEPEYIETGSQWDMRKSYENQAQKINQVADDYARGIIKSSSEARSQIAALNAELIKLGMKPIEIEIKTKGQQVLEDIQGYIGVFNTSIISTVDSFEQLANSIDEGASGWEIFKNTIAATEQVLTAFTTIMQVVNTLTQIHTANTMANTAATTADAAATTADAAASAGNAAAKSAEASATAGVAVAEAAAQNAKMGPVGWVMAIAAAVALAAVLFATIGKFAGGGIVGGNSFRGDKLIARVNSGEMILNGKQQKNLFDAINNNRLGSDGSQSISFKIKGSDLYGTLRNYSKIKGKSGVTTGIQ